MWKNEENRELSVRCEKLAEKILKASGNFLCQDNAREPTETYREFTASVLGKQTNRTEILDQAVAVLR